VARLRLQYLQWQHQASKEIYIADSQPTVIKSVFDKAQGKVLMDGLRAQFAQLIDTEYALRDQRIQNARRQAWISISACAILSILCGLILGYISHRHGRKIATVYEQALILSQRNRELLSATLYGIGDAVLATDSKGRVIMMNSVAEHLTGWTIQQALQKDAKEVFNIVNEATREPVESPIDRVIRDGVVVGLANHTMLIRRDGGEVPIDDSGAPIWNDEHGLYGVVLVFRDVTERRDAERKIADAYNREHRIAEYLQRAVTRRPNADMLPGLEVETVYRPALAEANVGGDFFDIYPLNNNRVALVVGDVSGKGLEAASRTAELKFTLRAYMNEFDDLANAIRRFNDFVCRGQSADSGFESFLCLSVAIMDSDAQTVTFCVAGSDPPLIYGPESGIKSIDTGGPPVGVIEGYVYDQEQVRLSDGDILLMSTDGITEARNGPHFMGGDGLTKLFCECAKRSSLNEVASGVVDGVAEFAHNILNDDLCLLLARVCAVY
jgi:PAS domain S-box-containing protein